MEYPRNSYYWHATYLPTREVCLVIMSRTIPPEIGCNMVTLVAYTGEEHDIDIFASVSNYYAPKRLVWGHESFWRRWCGARAWWLGYLQGDFPEQGWWGTGLPVPT